MYGHSLGLSMNPGPSASALETFSSAAAVFSYSTRRAIGVTRKMLKSSGVKNLVSKLY